MALKVGNTEITDVLLRDGTVIDSVRLKDGTEVYTRIKDYTDSSFSVSTSTGGDVNYSYFSRRANGAIYGVNVRTYSRASCSCSYTFTIPRGYVAYSVVKSNGNIGKTYAKEGTTLTVGASASADSDGYNPAYASASISSVSYYTS